MKHKSTIWDFIFLPRPILLIPVWTFLLLGYYRAGGERFSIGNDFLIVFLTYTLLVASVYVLNQIMDIKSDVINKKHLLLAEGFISVKNAYIEFAVLIAVALVLTARLPKHYIIFFLISFLFGIIYSVPPFKFKDRPISDFVINALGYGFLNFSIGWLTQRPLSIQTILYSLPYIFAVGAIFINTTILDIEGDKRSNAITTSIFLGMDNALRLSTTLIVLCIAVSILVKDRVCLIASLVALPLFMLALLKKDVKYVLLSIRIGGPLLVLIVGLIFPYFLPLILLIFLFLRIYYKANFSIAYPGLSIN